MVQGVRIEQGHIIDDDPSTGDVIDRVRVSSAEDVDRAVDAAKGAQRAWAAVPLEQRIETLRAAVKKLGEDQPGLARLITLEMGKVAREAAEEVGGACDKEELLSLIAAANAPERVGRCDIVRDAHGVCALCTPWNYPVDELMLLALPALAAANAVVLKPSEVAPLCGARVAAALADTLGAAGHPGLVGLVQARAPRPTPPPPSPPTPRSAGRRRCGQASRQPPLGRLRGHDGVVGDRIEDRRGVLGCI